MNHIKIAFYHARFLNYSNLQITISNNNQSYSNSWLTI